MSPANYGLEPPGENALQMLLLEKSVNLNTIYYKLASSFFTSPKRLRAYFAQLKNIISNQRNTIFHGRLVCTIGYGSSNNKLVSFPDFVVH